VRRRSVARFPAERVRCLGPLLVSRASHEGAARRPSHLPAGRGWRWRVGLEWGQQPPAAAGAAAAPGRPPGGGGPLPAVELPGAARSCCSGPRSAPRFRPGGARVSGAGADGRAAPAAPGPRRRCRGARTATEALVHGVPADFQPPWQLRCRRNHWLRRWRFSARGSWPLCNSGRPGRGCCVRSWRGWLDRPEQYNALRQLCRQRRLSC
jgi:hypothetical protein